MISDCSKEIIKEIIRIIEKNEWHRNHLFENFDANNDRFKKLTFLVKSKNDTSFDELKTVTDSIKNINTFPLIHEFEFSLSENDYQINTYKTDRKPMMITPSYTIELIHNKTTINAMVEDSFSSDFHIKQLNKSCHLLFNSLVFNELLISH